MMLASVATTVKEANRLAKSVNDNMFDYKSICILFDHRKQELVGYPHKAQLCTLVNNLYGSQGVGLRHVDRSLAALPSGIVCDAQRAR